MKGVVFLTCLFSLSTKIICDNAEKASEIGSDKPILTLITISGGLPSSEALARFERRAVFDGFKEGSTLKVILPRRLPISPSEKLGLVKTAVRKLASDSKEAADKHVMLYIENDLSLILSRPEDILAAFQSTGARILFPSDTTNDCWSHLLEKWPTEAGVQSPTLNAAAFIGYANNLVQLFAADSSTSLSAVFRAAYLENSIWTNLHMQIDSKSEVFYTLKSDSSLSEVELKLNKDGKFLIPQVVHTNTSLPLNIILTNLCKAGNSVAFLNSLGSYLTPTLPDDKIELYDDDDAWPVVTLAIFIEKPTPFMEEFFNDIEELEYNKKRIHLFIHNQYKYNAPHIEEFLSKNVNSYASVKYIESKEDVSEWAARKLAVNLAIENKSDYLFSVDSTAHFDEETTLKALIESNKQIVSPMLCVQTEFLPNICNWWGTISPDGWYTKSSDYDDIAEDNHKGIWNVPFVNAAYLIKAEILRNEETRPNFVHGLSDPDIAFAINNRARGIFMHTTNEFHPGHLISNENFETWHLHNELYELYDNRYDWENRYIHPNHSETLRENYVPLEPCQDVFWYPIVTPRFAKEMIEEMENYGKWADGSIEARGDLYPTVDIQMNEIGFDGHFHEFLRSYIQPLQDKSFKDYDVYPPRTDQAFVVRYSAEDQRELKPHFDESTYTLNIALNTPHKDFEGGGCRFTRFNCSVVDTRLGWGFLHPGQFTHKHEGLRITKGVRYILVAFVDPDRDIED